MARPGPFRTLLAIGAVTAAIAALALLARRSDEHVLKDIDGATYGSLEHPTQGRWSVLFFLTPDCPIKSIRP
ncbi:MAG TPA: hypothetical protein VFE29_04485 [Terriglobia bacterium]|nr:hypothetical protein [Terriglobia bacterium]